MVELKQAIRKGKMGSLEFWLIFVLQRLVCSGPFISTMYILY